MQSERIDDCDDDDDATEISTDSHDFAASTDEWKKTGVSR